MKPLELGSRVKSNIDRTVTLEMVRVTEAAARAAVKFMGQGNKNAVDGAAVEAMRRALNGLEINGTIVIGEGEKDKAPMLFIGEKVGTPEGRQYGPKLDLAVDPVDGTTLTSKGRENAIAVVAVAEEGCFLNVPDVHYMDKLAVGPGMNLADYSLDMPADEVVKIAAKQKKVPVDEIVVCLLDRDRNAPLMEGIRKAGARMKLITDGDVAGAIAAAMPDTGVDLLLGRGGAPEGVVAAAALKALGGGILCRMHFENDEMRKKTIARGHKNPDKTFTTDELASGEVVFAATGVTGGVWLKGVRRIPGGEYTHSVVMRSRTGTVRYVEAFHRTVG